LWICGLGIGLFLRAGRSGARPRRHWRCEQGLCSRPPTARVQQTVVFVVESYQETRFRWQDRIFRVKPSFDVGGYRSIQRASSNRNFGDWWAEADPQITCCHRERRLDGTNLMSPHHDNQNGARRMTSILLFQLPVVRAVPYDIGVLVFAIEPRLMCKLRGNLSSKL